jgi:hypothetical protein
MDANSFDPVSQATEPAEPQRLSVHVQRAGDSITLINTQRQWAIAAFLMVWLTGWTVGCVFLLGALLSKFSLVMLLFALPFLAAWLVVASILGGMIASRETLTLEEEGATYRRTVFGLPVAYRKVPLREITSFDTSVAKRQGRRLRRLEMQTIGAPLRLAADLTGEELAWLAHTFNASLASLKRYSGPIERTSPDEETPPLDPADLPPVLELRPPSASPVSRPSEAAWEQETTIDYIAFAQRGYITLAGLGGVLFVTVFWNSIVGIFVAGLLGFLPDGRKGGFAKGGEWWLLFFFLIPFELIGLGFFVALAMTLLEPLRRSRWIFHRHAIAYRVAWLGLGTTKRYAVDQLGRLELRKASEDEEDGETKPRKKQVQQQSQENEVNLATGEKPVGPRFSLAFVTKDGTDVCQIPNLSLGETCWMADVILRERVGWFV